MGSQADTAVLGDRRAHYLRPIEHTHLPRRHLVLDVETVPQEDDRGQQLSWRLACTRLIDGDLRRGWRLHPIEEWTQPFQLWSEVHSLVSAKHRLTVWCHNLAFDARASQALSFLPHMGYQLEQIALDRNAAWMRFGRDGASVHFCDLLCWLPAKLAVIGDELGIPKLDAGAGDGSDAWWMDRCRRDVEITSQAVVRLLELIETEDLGPFRPTGAGQSHSAWRRRWLTHRLLVHDQVRVLELERRAAWTGRCEAWQIGKLAGGPYVELDLDLAYCQIAADSEVPTVYAQELAQRDPEQVLAVADRDRVLARVKVRTEVPVVPAELDGFIVWPVGEFETVLWDPELRLALQHAEEVQVLEAHRYQRAPALADAARWLISQLASDQAADDPIRRRVLKHWARALVGRLALRYRSWEDWGWAETEDCRLGPMLDWETGLETELLQVGRQLKALAGMTEARDSLPQIPGWIMAECRSRLWQLMQAAGPAEVVYVDTDSIILTPAGARALQWVLGSQLAWPYHVKGTYHKLVVHGPRMLELDDSRRMAGVPLSASGRAGGGYRGEVWMSLAESLARGQARSVRVIGRDYDPVGVDRRRRHLDERHTAPFRLPATSGAGLAE